MRKIVGTDKSETDKNAVKLLVGECVENENMFLNTAKPAHEDLKVLYDISYICLIFLPNLYPFSTESLEFPFASTT